MATLRDLRPQCPCGLPAKVELMDSRKNRRGVFCQECGDLMLARLQKVEEGVITPGNEVA